MSLTLTLIHKNTYKAKEEIKSLGGRWNKAKKGWDLPSLLAYNEALELCQLFDSRENENSDAVEDVLGWRKFLPDVPDSSVTPIPLKGNTGKPVRSGVLLGGIQSGDIRTRHDTWVVTCKKEEWGQEFAVINTETLACRLMDEEEIRSYPWHGEDLDTAKKFWTKHLAQI